MDNNNTIKMDTFSLNDVASGVSTTLSSISFDKVSITSSFSALEGQGVAVNLVPSICNLIEALISRLKEVGEDIEEISFDQQVIDDELASASQSFTEDFSGSGTFSSENTNFETLEEKAGKNINNSNSQTSNDTSFDSGVEKEELKDITNSGANSSNNSNNSSSTVFEDFNMKKDELQNIVDSNESNASNLVNFEISHFFQFLKKVIGVDGDNLFSITSAINNDALLLSYLEEYKKEYMTVELPSMSLASLRELLIEKCNV